MGCSAPSQYMAPEQIKAHQRMLVTDVFAFGALLYEMLTGRMAFGRATKPIASRLCCGITLTRRCSKVAPRRR